MCCFTWTDHIRLISDVERPQTLVEMNVVQQSQVLVHDNSTVSVHFTPTNPHCSLASFIGLCLHVKLLRTLPSRFKVTISITPGSHVSEAEINAQLQDKERVAAAMTKQSLMQMVDQCIMVPA